jgi:hypothetical protein
MGAQSHGSAKADRQAAEVLLGGYFFLFAIAAALFAV